MKIRTGTRVFTTDGHGRVIDQTQWSWFVELDTEPGSHKLGLRRWYVKDRVTAE